MNNNNDPLTTGAERMMEAVEDLFTERPSWTSEGGYHLTITEARIEHTAGRSHVWVRCGDTDEKVVVSYYADELTFTPEEFVGLTILQATNLFYHRDMEYLRS